MKAKKLFTHLVAVLMLVVLTHASVLSAQETSDEKKQRVKAKVVDGQVIIIDSSGKERVIDLSEGEASEIIVQQNVESDGKNEKRTGRAIIVGPDGKRQVVELDDLPGKPGVFAWRPGAQGRMLFSREGEPMILSGEGLEGVQDFALSLGGSKFMIGVSCEPVSSAMKAHLDIENGLVVEEVVDDSPAEKAGVKQFDILIQVNGDDLETVDQLVKAVQAAGEEESGIKIKARRRGKTVEFEIEPEKRKATSWEFEFPAGENEENIRERLRGMLGEKGLEGLNHFRVERLGPGIIQRQHDASDMEDQIEELKKQVEELQRMIRELKNR